MQFRCLLQDSLYIIPQTFAFVKGFFKSFLRFFKVFFRQPSRSALSHFVSLNQDLKDRPKAEMLFLSAVSPPVHVRIPSLHGSPGTIRCLSVVTIYWMFLHLLCLPSGQLIYYTTIALFCQGVFRHFFRFVAISIIYSV